VRLAFCETISFSLPPPPLSLSPSRTSATLRTRRIRRTEISVTARDCRAFAFTVRVLAVIASRADVNFGAEMRAFDSDDEAIPANADNVLYRAS